ncbi:hypothetical protein CIRMBP1284_01797 [Enterococcus cecorum]|nr:hypothetical protein CIRMBP1272_01261 [Enterococcus cecorum]CAI3383697.1 hypothetical protein CIRMBP1298_00829 [Enterococcus cecorum]CAI3423116.1 hypothetical protein CIRMBP1302_01216 [Enterococcus cecorum]CAI3428982.1 hypothetical protein CIRMBP1284_01797 [Enterococcus cecorum]CAI3480561.1 hypothetical protein CIRMBP1248_02382 [Enterococcus cecorum]
MDRFIELINKIIQPDNFTKFVPIFVSIGGMIPLILKYVDYFKADSFTKQFFFKSKFQILHYFFLFCYIAFTTFYICALPIYIANIITNKSFLYNFNYFFLQFASIETIFVSLILAYKYKSIHSNSLYYIFFKTHDCKEKYYIKNIILDNLVLLLSEYDNPNSKRILTSYQNILDTEIFTEDSLKVSTKDRKKMNILINLLIILSIIIYIVSIIKIMIHL